MINVHMSKLIEQFGGAFYILNSNQFIQNYCELKNEFTKIYPHFNIAYSYKTNYIPKLCKIVNELGGYAEVVSDMELEIALRVGVEPSNIIWNGPFKNANKVEELLLQGGLVNIDAAYEIILIEEIVKKYPHKQINVGIRCNFEINDNVVSRFGIGVETEDFQKAVDLTKKYSNVYLKSLQCHFATRKLETWAPRVRGMLNIIDKYELKPDYIDLGGGLFGKMSESLKKQFDSMIPSYQEYAKEVATIFAKHFENIDYKPMLIIEPGSALVGDCMHFASKVVNIKNVRGKNIATLLGSIYNINPTLNKKNPPIEVYHVGKNQKDYIDLDFGGFTCIESDYLYRHYDGKLGINDVVVFGNVGSYSVVLKPPFILPNFPIIEIDGDKVTVIKRQENFDDIFHTYTF